MSQQGLTASMCQSCESNAGLGDEQDPRSPDVHRFVCPGTSIAMCPLYDNLNLAMPLVMATKESSMAGSGPTDRGGGVQLSAGEASV